MCVARARRWLPYAIFAVDSVAVECAVLERVAVESGTDVTWPDWNVLISGDEWTG